MEIPGKVPKYNWLCVLQPWLRLLLHLHSPQAEGSFNWQMKSNTVIYHSSGHKKFQQWCMPISDRALSNSQSLISLTIPLQEGTKKK